MIVLPTASADWIVSCTSVNMLATSPIYTKFWPYVYTRIDNLNYPTNSSVSFIDDPTLLFCVNQPAWASFTAVDPDGDSIVYSFDSLLVDTVICPPSPYISTFNYSYPLTSSTTYFIDSNAGWIHFNPVFLEVGSICIKASEYRAQTLINETTYMLNMSTTFGCVISNLSDNHNNNELVVFYDLNRDVIQLHAEQFSGSAFLYIYDNMGRLVTSDNWENIQNDKDIALPMISSGMYFISATIKQINSKELIKTSRFIKR
ncbi:MAG: T9SS type A sorting domain-containing protein [Bacteroidetes bacterium]|nr:T9SS type A sorting domain-containing protein [Bacteroidota bacterium]